jgi:hypothetical protein
MPTAVPVLCVQAEDIPLQGLDGWADACGSALDAGERMLTLYGRPAGSGLLLTAVLQDPSGRMRLLRCAAARGAAYPALTARFPVYG